MPLRHLCKDAVILHNKYIYSRTIHLVVREPWCELFPVKRIATFSSAKMESLRFKKTAIEATEGSFQRQIIPAVEVGFKWLPCKAKLTMELEQRSLNQKRSFCYCCCCLWCCCCCCCCCRFVAFFFFLSDSHRFAKQESVAKKVRVRSSLASLASLAALASLASLASV